MLVRFLCLQDPGNNDLEIIQNNVLTEMRFCKISFGITSVFIDKGCGIVEKTLCHLHNEDLYSRAKNISERSSYFCKSTDRLAAF